MSETSSTGFKGIMPAFATRPPTKRSMVSPIIRDHFTITTWLCLGAVAQGVLFLLLGNLALLPAATVIVVKLVDTLLQTYNLRHNPHMDGVLMKKFTAQIPDSKGNFSPKPASSDIVVFHIGTRCNHPLGIFAPGFKEMGAYFQKMLEDLEEHAEEFGFMGQSSWIAASGRDTSNELMTVQYFRSVEGLHSYAHSKIHMEAWSWWFKHVKEYPYLSIYHETFEVPKGHWETIYMNTHVNHLALATVPVTEEKTGRKMWAGTVVDIAKGKKLNSMLGRMDQERASDEKTGYGTETNV